MKLIEVNEIPTSGEFVAIWIDINDNLSSKKFKYNNSSVLLIWSIDGFVPTYWDIKDLPYNARFFIRDRRITDRRKILKVEGLEFSFTDDK